MVRLLRLQFALVLGLTILAGCIGSLTSARAVLLGGLTSILPHSYFAYRAFRHQGALAAHQIVRDFYFGQACKFMLTIMLFCLDFIVFKPAAKPFFMGFILLQSSHWLLLWFKPYSSRQGMMRCM